MRLTDVFSHFPLSFGLIQKAGDLVELNRWEGCRSRFAACTLISYGDQGKLVHEPTA
jgi:hypothetical protein